MCYIRGTCYVSILRTCHSEVDRGIKICSAAVGVFSVSRELLRLNLPASFKVHLRQKSFTGTFGRHRRKSIGVIHTIPRLPQSSPRPKFPSRSTTPQKPCHTHNNPAQPLFGVTQTTREIWPLTTNSFCIGLILFSSHSSSEHIRAAIRACHSCSTFPKHSTDPGRCQNFSAETFSAFRHPPLNVAVLANSTSPAIQTSCRL